MPLQPTGCSQTRWRPAATSPPVVRDAATRSGASPGFGTAFGHRHGKAPSTRLRYAQGLIVLSATGRASYSSSRAQVYALTLAQATSQRQRENTGLPARLDRAPSGRIDHGLGRWLCRL